MVTKELIKAEIDKIPDEYLEVLYKIIKALETPVEVEVSHPKDDEPSEWRKFVQETYGCLADDPIRRGDQGTYEIREQI